MNRILFWLMLLALSAAVSCQPDRLTLSLENREAAPGGQVCLPVKASRFENMLTMQYTISWDEKVLRYAKVADFGLPGLTDLNFGHPKEHPGSMTLSWFEPNLNPVTVPDGTVLFNVCFDVVGKAGDRSAVEINDHPTVIEIANIKEEVLKPVLEQGSVEVK